LIMADRGLTWVSAQDTQPAISSGASTYTPCATADPGIARAGQQGIARAGQQGGVEHFGIHLAEASAAAVDEAVRRAEQAGGHLVERGEHAPGLPYAFVADPDGYTIEISGSGPVAFTPPTAR